MNDLLVEQFADFWRIAIECVKQSRTKQTGYCTNKKCTKYDFFLNFYFFVRSCKKVDSDCNKRNSSFKNNETGTFNLLN
jgi:hypothetical protein